MSENENALKMYMHIIPNTVRRRLTELNICSMCRPSDDLLSTYSYTEDSHNMILVQVVDHLLKMLLKMAGHHQG